MWALLRVDLGSVVSVLDAHGGCGTFQRRLSRSAHVSRLQSLLRVAVEVVDGLEGFRGRKRDNQTVFW